MDINRANLQIFFQDLEVRFNKGFNAVREMTIFQTIAMIIPSTSASSVHAWLDQIPSMREWLGDRIAKNIRSDSLTVINRLFEATIPIPRVDIDDDTHGIYGNLAESMGEAAGALPDQIIVEVVTGNPNWADGAPFFGTSRTYAGNVILNATANNLDEAEFEIAYETMQSYLGQGDDPLNVRPITLTVGPTNRKTAFDITENQNRAIVASDGTSFVHAENRNKGLVDHKVSSRLVGANANAWLLSGELSGIKGIAWQERNKAEFQNSRISDDSDHVFEFDEFQFGTRARGEAFLTLPHLLYRGGLAI